MRILGGGAEIVDQGLRIGGIVIYDPGEVTFEMGIVLVKPLLDEEGMLMVLGEDDRLTEGISPLHLQAVLHQML